MCIRNLVMIVAASLAALLGVGQVQAETRLVAHHGVWNVLCPETNGGLASVDCMMAFDLGEVPDLRSVTVKRRSDGNIMMRLTFVVGISLPRGVDLMFDGEKKGRLQFEKCLPQDGGCIVEFDATPLLDRLKVGGVMTLAFSREANSTTTANVSIDGFAEALDALDALVPAAATAPPGARATVAHGAWKMICEDATDGAGARRCNAIQSASDAATGDMLSVVLVKRRDAGVLMHVSVSGEILIRPGLTLAIDGQPQGVVQFDVCGQAGCTVEVQLADIVVERMRAGKTSTFAYKVRPELAITIPLTIDGFDEAYQDIVSGD